MKLLILVFGCLFINQTFGQGGTDSVFYGKEPVSDTAQILQTALRSLKTGNISLSDTVHILRAKLQSLRTGATKEYVAFAIKADSCLFANDYKNAADLYEEAFISSNGLGIVADRYKAAMAWALLNKADKAFEQLNRIVTKGKFKGYDLINNDLSFLSLHADKRWEPLMALVIQNQKE